MSRAIRSSSVVLPEPVLPMIAVTLPGARHERDAAQDGQLGARIAVLDVSQLDEAGPGSTT